MDAEGICSMAARQPLVAVTFSPEFVVSAGADRQQAVMDGSEVTVFHLVGVLTYIYSDTFGSIGVQVRMSSPPAMIPRQELSILRLLNTSADIKQAFIPRGCVRKLNFKRSRWASDVAIMVVLI
ncbi:hypothetical protein H103_07059 [Trichophyton rubrum CBS 288.86]|uniref:Uncharacterized protein n=2 Tax=Trichophyton TaxID=5550 RepID=A0A022VUD4_TRIRU|nr:hypothetical protein H100_07075 [Trichophyton rubrum MR850]EZF49353.1 hypothetical protein H103_07059 [Trichophyton rubrum CBS 288.86]EZF70616.1 hypothetical protein H105_07072 [Trichophyton soudanense CBS 452.61]